MVGTDLRFIRLHFSRLTFTARNGGKPDVTPYIEKVELDGPLKFVDSIKDYLKTPGTGPNIDITPAHIEAGFTLHIPNIPAGAVTIINIAFSASLIIPFNGDPARARFAMSSREHPFLVTYLALGGGGFFAIELGLDGVKYFELDIVAGVEAAIDLILVTAEVHYLFGVHIGIDSSNKVDQISYIRIGGHCGVWGVWSVTLDMYLALDYDSDSNELRGQARFTIEIEYLFLSKSVDLFVERRIAGPAGASGIPEDAAAARLGPGTGGLDGFASLASYTQPSSSSTTASATSSPAHRLREPREPERLERVRGRVRRQRVGIGEETFRGQAARHLHRAPQRRGLERQAPAVRLRVAVPPARGRRPGRPGPVPGLARLAEPGAHLRGPVRPGRTYPARTRRRDPCRPCATQRSLDEPVRVRCAGRSRRPDHGGRRTCGARDIGRRVVHVPEL